MSSDWIQQHDSYDFVKSFEESSFRHNGSYGFYEIRVQGTNFQLIFPEEKEKDEVLISYAQEIINKITVHDLYVQNHTVDGEFEFSLGSIEIAYDEVSFEYTGDNYNASWGAYFKKDAERNWSMYDWG